MVVIPSPVAFGAFSSPTTVFEGSDLSPNSLDDFTIGTYQSFETPHGMVANADGVFQAYPVVVDENGEYSLLFSKTTGSTWSTPLNVTTVQTQGFGYEIDNVHVFANSSTDTIDILFTEVTGGGGGQDIMHVRSTDNGDSFGSATQAVSTPTGTNDVVWYDVDGNHIAIVNLDADDQELEFTKSSNGGSSFGSQVVIDDDTGASEDNVAGNFFNVVVQQESDGSNVWVIFSAEEFSNNDQDVWTSYSNDSGASFTTPFQISQESTQVDEGQEFRNHLFVDEAQNEVVAVFQGTGGGGTPYFSIAKSTNNGASFATQDDIYVGTTCDWDHFATQDGGHITTRSGDNIHVICVIDDEGNNDEVWAGVSTDFGDNWSSLQQISEDGLTDWAIQNPVTIKAVGDQTYAMWQFQDTGFDTRLGFASSTDAGSNWSTPENVTSTENDIGESKGHLQGFAENVWISLKNGSDELVAWFQSFDSDIPVIVVSGDNPLTVAKDSVYNDPSATCIDPTEGDISGNIIISGDTVDTATVGSYDRDYNCQDTAGNDAVEVTLTVNVVDDTTPPVIASVETQPITVLQDTVFDPEDGHVTCTDDNDGDITGSIVVESNPVDTSDLGVYLVTYSCEDASENGVQTQIEFIVKRLGTGTGSGTTNGALSFGSQNENQVQRDFSNVPPLTNPLTGEPMEETVAQVQEQLSPFEQLFAGFVENFQQQSVVSDQITSGQVVPSQDAGGFTSNPIADFFNDIFGAFFR